MTINELDENKLDKCISLAKSVLGEIPMGSLIGEILGNLIPNQRLDRITKFIRILEEKFSALENIVAAHTEKQSEYLTLLENGMFFAYRANSEERLEYIATVVANGLTDEQIEISRYIYILNILSELNDEEIIWLRFYLHPIIGGDEDFRNKHSKTLTLARSYMGASEEELNKSAIQDSYKEHLERLGLIYTKIDIDRKTNMPNYDKFSGKPKGSKYITRLGKMLLKEIGFSNIQK